MEDKLVWFNGKGDSLNFNFNEDLERYEGKMIFDHSSNDVFKTIPLYCFENVGDFEYSQGEELNLEKFQLFNENIFNFVGSPFENEKMDLLETVNNDSTFFSKWITGNNFETKFPLGTHIVFDQQWVEFNSEVLSYVVVQTKKNAIMILSNTNNEQFNDLYGTEILVDGYFDDKTISAINLLKVENYSNGPNLDNLSDWNEPRFYNRIYEGQKMSLMGTELNDSVYTVERADMSDSIYTAYSLTSAELPDYSDIKLQLKLKTDLPKIYNGDLFFDNQGRVDFEDGVPSILVPDRQFQVLNSVDNNNFLVVSPMRRFTSDIPSAYVVDELVILNNIVYQAIQSYTQSTTDDSTYPTNNEEIWGPADHIFVNQETFAEPVISSEVYLTTNILEFNQVWDTNKAITMASAVEKYKEDFAVFNIRLEYDSVRLALEDDDRINVCLNYPTKYAEVEFEITGTYSPTASIITNEVVNYEKLIQVVEDVVLEKNMNKSEIFQYDVVITDLDEFGLYLDLNGLEYFTETSFSFDGAEVDLLRTIHKTLNDFLDNYFTKLFQLGVVVEILYIGEGSSLYVNAIRFKSFYPNVPFDFDIRVGTTADFYMPHSKVFFARMGNQLKVTLNDRVLLQEFNTDVTTTIADWITTHQEDLVPFGIYVSASADNLIFDRKDISQRVDYIIEIGELYKPGEVPFEIFEYTAGNEGALITSNQIKQGSVEQGSAISFEEQGFSTGMVIGMNKSAYTLENVEFNVLYVDEEQMVLSYQGPFWGTVSDEEKNAFVSSAFDVGFGYDPDGNNIEVDLLSQFLSNELTITDNVVDSVLHIASNAAYAFGDDISVMDSELGNILTTIVLGATNSKTIQINTFNDRIYALSADTLYRIDPYDKVLSATISVSNATDMAISADGNIFIATSDSTAIVYDVSNALVSTIVLNAPATEIVYDIDDDKMYVATITEITVIDADTLAIVDDYTPGTGLYYNETDGKIYGYEAGTLFTINSPKEILPIPVTSFVSIDVNTILDITYASTDDSLLYEINGNGDLIKTTGLGNYGFIKFNPYDQFLYIAVQTGTPEVIIYDPVNAITIGNKSLLDYGTAIDFNDDRNSIYVTIAGNSTAVEIVSQVTSAQITDHNSFSAAFASAYGLGIQDVTAVEDDMYGSLSKEYRSKSRLWINTRPTLRRPRENYDGDIDIQYRFRWLDDTIPQIFMYDVSGDQIPDNGALTYVGEKPLEDPRLIGVANNNPDRISDPTVQQTVFPEIVYDLEKNNTPTVVQVLPEPLEIFIGFQSQEEGVLNSTLIMEKIEPIEFTITTDEFNGDVIEFKNLTTNDNITFGQIVLSQLSTEIFLYRSLKVGQMIQIFVKDITNNVNQSISYNNGKIFKITGVFNRIIEVEYVDTQLVDETTEISNYPGKGDITHLSTTIKVLPTEIGRFEIYSETEIEDERFSINLGNEGKNINSNEIFMFRSYDIQEEGVDWHFVNKKRKEMLLVKNEIYPYIGSYKSIINAINFFGYNELDLYEYYRNVNRKSKNFGKLFKVEIPDIFDNQVEGWTDNDFIKHTFPNANFANTNLFNLSFDITDKEGNNKLLFSLDEVLIKLTGLKVWLETNIVPLTHDILDITGRADFVGERTIRHESHNVVIINTNDSMTPVNFAINEAYVLPVNSGSTVYNVVIDYSTADDDVPDSYTTEIRTYQIYEDWDPFNTYSQDDQIRYLGRQFESVNDNNKLNNPNKYTDAPTWTDAVTYRRGEFVEYNRDHYKYVAGTTASATASTPYNNPEWDVVTEWKEVDLAPVQYIQEFRTGDNLLPFNFTLDTNIDPYVEIIVTSDNGYGENYTFRKNVEVRFDADSDLVLSLF